MVGTRLCGQVSTPASVTWKHVMHEPVVLTRAVWRPLPTSSGDGWQHPPTFLSVAVKGVAAGI